MALYRLCLLGQNGKVIAVQRFHADADKEAWSIARETVKGAAKVSGFELWEGVRKVLQREGGKMTRQRARDG
jgi:hypothetical protein